MNYGYGYGNASQVFGIFALVWGIAIGVSLLIGIVVYVLMGFSFMKLFRKVGVEPWAAWVPVFNLWRILELGGQPGWISLISFVPYGSFVTVVFECIGAYRTGTAFRKDGSWVVLFIFLPYVWAWMLAADGVTYEPSTFTERGWPPPLVGHGSARGPYVPPTAPPAAAV